MYTAQQVANYVVEYGLRNNIPISNLKLQKLLYFIWIDYYKKEKRYLFGENFYAWKFGPVVPEVYYEYCAYGGFSIFCPANNSDAIQQKDKSIINETVENYRNFSVGYLVELSHKDGKPWADIFRKGLGERKVIPFEKIINSEC